MVKIHDRQNEQIMLCSSIAIIVIIFKHYVLNKNCVCLKEQHKHRLHFSKSKNEASSHLNDTPLAWLTWCPSLAAFRQFFHPGEDWISWIRNTWWSRWESRTNDSNIARQFPLTRLERAVILQQSFTTFSTDQFCWWMATLLGWWNDPFTQVTVSDLQLHGIKRSNWITSYRDIFPVRVSVVCLVNETWSFRWDNLR